MWCHTLLVSVVVAMLSPAGAVQTARDLPELIKVQLSTEYPGWRFAALDPRFYPELSAELGRRRSPEWVTADFDGDRRADYAVAIVQPGTAVNTQLVVVFLARPATYDRVVIQTMPEQTGTYLRIARQGDRVRDFDQDPNGRISFILRLDAVDIVNAGTAATTCLYDIGRWRCFVSAD